MADNKERQQTRAEAPSGQPSNAVTAAKTVASAPNVNWSVATRLFRVSEPVREVVARGKAENAKVMG